MVSSGVVQWVSFPVGGSVYSGAGLPSRGAAKGPTSRRLTEQERAGHECRLQHGCLGELVGGDLIRTLSAPCGSGLGLGLGMVGLGLGLGSGLGMMGLGFRLGLRLRSKTGIMLRATLNLAKQLQSSANSKG